MASIGIIWVNEYHGRADNLYKNDDNARGFYNTLHGVRQFDYGNDNAWDQHLEQAGVGSPARGSDRILADNVDIVYFSGHGTPNGPLFGVATHDDGIAKPTEMRLGDQQAEWIIFDACEVLQSSDRWHSVFRGLHFILGFSTVCTDVRDRGQKFAEYLNDGNWILGSWIAACEETEGSDVRCAALWAEDSRVGTNTYHDHWHGKGYVSPDPDSPDDFYHFSTPC